MSCKKNYFFHEGFQNKEENNVNLKNTQPEKNEVKKGNDLNTMVLLFIKVVMIIIVMFMIYNKFKKI